MARKIKTTKSPEERRAEAEGLHGVACEKVKYPTVSLDVAGLGLAGRVGVGCLSR